MTMNSPVPRRNIWNSFAGFVSESEIKDFTAVQNQEYTEKFTYPAYELEFTTGANEDTCKWKMLYFQTDTNTFAYAYRVSAVFADGDGGRNTGCHFFSGADGD